MASLIRRALLLAVFSLALTAGAAAAAEPSRPHLTVTPFSAAYDNGPGGFYTCAGDRIVSTGSVAFTKDLEVCSITDVATVGDPPGVYPIVETGTGPHQFVFYSDYDSQQAVSGVIVIIAHRNGTGTVLIEANY